MNFKRVIGKWKYGIAMILVKIISPNMFKKLDAFGLIKNGIYPRPSIKFMKEHFNNKKVIGVEIGVLKGKNALSIYKTLNIDILYLIDFWNSQELIQEYSKLAQKNYLKTIKRFRNKSNVVIYKCTSLEAVNLFSDDSIDFCYIDANHNYEYVKQDIELWNKKVKINGVIGGHDIIHFQTLGVYQAIKEFSEKNNIIYEMNAPDWYFIKKEKND